MINWKWFVVEGCILVGLGVFAIARPGIAAEAIAMLVGWLLVLSGFIALLGGISNQVGPRSPISFATGLLMLLFGCTLLIMPEPALATITILLAIFFFISGMIEISSSLSLRSQEGKFNHWGIAFFQGMISITLGLLLIALWSTSYEVVGLIVGINFLLSGLYLISLGWFFKHTPAF